MAYPNTSAVNSNWIEGRALQKSTKNVQKLKKKRQENESETRMDFGSMLAPFWEALGTILGAKMPSKIEGSFGCDFVGQKRGGTDFVWVGPAECAGPVGRIMEGYENIQKRQGYEDKAKEI